MADCAGTPTTLGSRFFAKQPVAAADSAAVARMRRAGLVIVGRTNTSEFGLAPTTEPAFGGATLNPWRKGLSPGGSSGGSAAVVAARGLPMAHATDGGGSIRIPAALCGLFGLKPSRGRVSLAPIGETLAGAGAQHCVSISVRDSAALLDALAGSEPGDPYTAPAAGSFLAATQRPPGKLRVAFMRKPVGGDAARSRAGRRRRAHGEAARGARPSGRGGLARLRRRGGRRRRWARSCAANTWTNIQIRANGRVPGPDDLEPVTRQAAEHGRADQRPRLHPRRPDLPSHRPPARRLLRAARRAAVADDRAHRRCRSARCAWTAAASNIEQGLAPMVAFTSVCNATGVPAMSVPLAWTDDGLPIGLQFVGRFGAEEMLFSLAAQLEHAQPWRDRRPAREHSHEQLDAYDPRRIYRRRRKRSDLPSVRLLARDRARLRPVADLQHAAGAAVGRADHRVGGLLGRPVGHRSPRSSCRACPARWAACWAGCCSPASSSRWSTGSSCCRSRARPWAAASACRASWSCRSSMRSGASACG